MHSLCTTLCSHPVLALFDFTKPFCIKSNASDTAVGGVVTQKHACIHKPIAFLINTLMINKQSSSIHEYKLLAIVTYCKAWRLYIDGQ